ncbi:VOC family protein [Geodermatophilus sabuli]|uniref:VOC family protein n=1 Tax=Geodermatophilus sabuli TaxID=1564158 RepID=A0A7K3W4S6_9ACTN|nr:VOC family protein [Geodermatophilus sabuli]NEK59363.1 VOC family protein [Geodermatophilus sabuli]
MPANPVRHITIDAHDPLRLARFWAEVTGFVVEDEPEDDEVLLEPPSDQAPGLLFIRVPDEKVAKNRVHLDIEPPTGTRDEAVQRLLALGATMHEDHRRASDGLGWVTLRDPEGNEFCVERSAAERAG